MHWNCLGIGRRPRGRGEEADPRLERHYRLYQRFLACFRAGRNDLFWRFRWKILGAEPGWFAKMGISSGLRNQIFTSVSAGRYSVFWKPGSQILRGPPGRKKTMGTQDRRMGGQFARAWQRWDDLFWV